MFLRGLSAFILRDRKGSVLSRQNGFSMIELILSVGAISLFAILVQSMLILGHSFTRSQQNFFDFLQATQLIKQKMCVNNTSFKNINLDLNKSYKRNVTVITKYKNGNPYSVYLRDYENLGSTRGDPILGLWIFNISTEPSFKDSVITSAIQDTSNPYIDRNKDDDGDGDGDIDAAADVDAPLYYKIYQDSHTIVKMNFDSATINTSGGFLSGYIFASRCVANNSSSIYVSDSHRFTFNPKALKKSALYILSELEYKPYYFPSTESNEYEIKCCTNPESSSTCVPANKGWVPRIYVIHLQSIGEVPPPPPLSSLPSSDYGFSGNVSYIQELPEMQDVNNIWGMGFMLSMDSKTSLSQSSFQLDTMFLKNACATSVTNIQKCSDISLGTDLSTQSLHGVNTSVRNMIDYITPDVSSCAGYSSGVDTSSLITL